MTEENAEKIFENVEDDILSLLKKEKYNGFKYLALIKNNDSFLFELSFNPNKMKTEDFEDLKNILENLLFPYPIVETLSFSKKIRGVQSSKNFEFHIHKNHSRKFSKYSTNDSKIQAGDEISNIFRGTLGAILSLKKSKSYFLLSNYHVMMDHNSNLNDTIKDKLNNDIAELHWGVFNKTHDVALAKITKSNLEEGTRLYNFGSIEKPSFSMGLCRTISKKGPKGGGEIFSTKAIVSIKKNIFKDQVLFKKFHLNPGDSGSVIVENNQGNLKNVIGICMGGDNQIDVVNKLHTLCENKIDATIDIHNRSLPSIHFNSFY